MKYSIIPLSIALLTSSIALAQPDISNEVSDDDNVKIDKIADSLFKNLQNGDSKLAVKEVFASSRIMQQKQQDTQLLTSQIDSTFSIYGKMGDCHLASLRNYAGLVQKRQYLCQQEDYVLRWTLVFGKTSRSWTTLSLIFDENVTRIDRRREAKR